MVHEGRCHLRKRTQYEPRGKKNYQFHHQRQHGNNQEVGPAIFLVKG